MSEQLPPTDRSSRHVLTPALRADIAIALDLAIRDPQSPEISRIMTRVAEAAARDQVRPEELLVFVKGLWKEKEAPRVSDWLPADRAWLTLVRTLMEAYYATSGPEVTPRQTLS